MNRIHDEPNVTLPLKYFNSKKLHKIAKNTVIINTIQGWD